jgi:excisionase family DNA binding protein
MNEYKKKEHESLERPMTFTEACDFLQVSKSTLYKLTHRKRIKFYNPGGKRLYFKKSDLLEWVYGNPPLDNVIENLRDEKWMKIGNIS